MTLQLKEAVPDQLPELNRLLRLAKAHWGYDTDFLDRFMQKRAISLRYLKTAKLKIVFHEGQLIGFYGFIYNLDHSLVLDYFFIRQDRIGQGLGRKLWLACCREARELGEDEFRIWSDPHAEGFYLKMGCERIGVYPSKLAPDRSPPVLLFKLR